MIILIIYKHIKGEKFKDFAISIDIFSKIFGTCKFKLINVKF